MIRAEGPRALRAGLFVCGSLWSPRRMSLGKHVLLDLYGCAPSALDDVGLLERLALEAVRASKGTILGHQSHKFTPQGATVLVMVAESHLSLHTWPEHGYVAVDYFTCGDRVLTDEAVRTLQEGLRPEHMTRRDVARGDEASRSLPQRVLPAMATNAK